MTRELKLALIVGFSVLLLVTVLISDHLSSGRKGASSQPKPSLVPAGVAGMPTASGSATDDLLGPAPVNALRDSYDPQPYSITQGAQNALASNEAGGSDWARRAGDVLNGNEGLPPQLETTPLPLGQNGVPVLNERSFDAARPGMNTAPIGVTPRIEYASATGGQTPTSPEIVVASASDELRLPQGRPLPTLIDPIIPPAMPEPATTPKPLAEMRTHTVVEGDSLYAIAKKHYGNGELWPKLAEANKDRLGKNNTLRLGVKIRLPDASSLGVKVASSDPTAKPAQTKLEARPVAKGEAKPASKPASPATPASGSAKPGQRTYVVKEGDSLARIAQDQLGTVKRMPEILALNPKIKNADQVAAGMKLALPAR